MYDIYRPRPTNRGIWVYDRSRERVGLINEYTSLIMERQHFDIGKFSLTLPVSATDADTLEDDRIICLGQSGARAGIVQRIEQDRERGPKFVKIEGRMLKGLAHRRIIVPPTATEDPEALGWDRTNGTAEEVYRHYVSRHIVSPTDVNRALPGVVLDDLAAPPRGISTPWQCQHDERLEDVLPEIGAWTDMGWDMRFDVRTKQIVFVCVPGRDLTQGNAEGNSPVIFSEGFGNIVNTRVLLDKSEFVNSPYLGGAGEDENQLVLAAYVDDAGQQIAEPLTGWDRREGWISVGNETDPAALITGGLQKLHDGWRYIRGLEATVTPTGAFSYGVDWDVGDKVTAIVDVLGKRLRFDARVTMAREVYERAGSKIEVVLGSEALKLTDRITELRKRK